MTFLEKISLHSCLVEGYLGQVATRTAMQVHFLYWHVLDTVVILEEGNLPHPQCAQCDMLVPGRP